ncbi:hypothetical protein AX17_007146 [Amanita inopinata Kibby_2008]|nr:hypothetical protein AX17_007146 [Amanita inopinata Kibby_2008]
MSRLRPQPMMSRALSGKPLYMRYINSTTITSFRPMSDHAKGGLSQGHATDPKSAQNRDPQVQSVKAGSEARSQESDALDAASSKEKVKPEHRGVGNPENIGFVEQVGSQSATARRFENKESEEKHG